MSIPIIAERSQVRCSERIAGLATLREACALLGLMWRFGCASKLGEFKQRGASNSLFP
jgi:hypothetical protein